MSIKSLLQVILFLLIIIIVGGIYVIYFYAGPIKNNEIITNGVNLEKSGDKRDLTTNQEILEGINSKQDKEVESLVDISMKKLNDIKELTKDKKNKKSQII